VTSRRRFLQLTSAASLAGAQAAEKIDRRALVRRHNPVATKSNTEIGKLRSISTLCGR